MRYIVLAMKEPKTLQQAIQYFSDPDNCLKYMVARRWPTGVVTCPTCGSADVHFIPTRRLWECKTKHPKRQFSPKVGTIMEDSAVGLDKWLTAMWMVANCKNGVSSWEIHRTIGVTQKTGWFMLHRIRLSMKREAEMMGGPGSEVEVDETFIGPKPKRMHKDRRARLEQIRSNIPDEDAGVRAGKTAVMGILDRDARQVRAAVVPNIRRDVLQWKILKNVHRGTTLYTDQATAYESISQSGYIHDVVNHSETYVNGRVHTNGLENFWSLLKRMLGGTYVAVEPFHLDRYIDEQVFRYNNRHTKDNPLDDSDRFALMVAGIAGKRLTYNELTGKTGSEANI